MKSELAKFHKWNYQLHINGVPFEWENMGEPTVFSTCADMCLVTRIRFQTTETSVCVPSAHYDVVQDA